MIAAVKLCFRCGLRPRHTASWCRDCAAVYLKTWRAARKRRHAAYLKLLRSNRLHP